MHHQTHLLKRNGVYYFRMRIPVDIGSFERFNGEIKYSLKTKNLKEAKRLVQSAVATFQTRFQETRDALARARGDIKPRILTKLDETTIKQICNYILQMFLQSDDIKRSEGLTREALNEYMAETNKTYQNMREAVARGDISQVQQLLTHTPYFLGFELRCNAADYHALSYEMLKTMGSYVDVVKRRNDGEVIATETVVDESKAWTPPASPTPKARGTSLEGIFEHWKNAIADRSEKTIKAFNAVLTDFARFVKYKSAHSLVHGDFIDYRDHLLNTEKLHYNTVEKRLSLLNAIFQRATDDGKLTANPAARVRVAKPKVDDRKRQPYSLDDLMLIFASDLYTKRARPRGCGGEAAVWLPLLAAYTGARLEELGQLQVEDIKHDLTHGRYIEIGLAPGRKVKTESSRRRVPVHPELIKAGFLRYRDQLLTAKETRLFPDLNEDSKGDITGNWSKWWGRYARKHIGLADRRKVFHSFRHSFKDFCRASSIPEDIHDAITGHTHNSVGRAYGSAQYPLAPLFEAMQRFQYPDLKIPVIVPEDDIQPHHQKRREATRKPAITVSRRKTNKAKFRK